MVGIVLGNNGSQLDPLLLYFFVLNFTYILQDTLDPLLPNIAVLEKAQHIEVGDLKNAFFGFGAGLCPSDQDGQNVPLVYDPQLEKLILNSQYFTHHTHQANDLLAHCPL